MTLVTHPINCWQTTFPIISINHESYSIYHDIMIYWITLRISWYTINYITNHDIMNIPYTYPWKIYFQLYIPWLIMKKTGHIWCITTIIKSPFNSNHIVGYCWWVISHVNITISFDFYPLYPNDSYEKKHPTIQHPRFTIFLWFPSQLQSIGYSKSITTVFRINFCHHP